MTLEYKELVVMGIGLVSIFSPPSVIAPFAVLCGEYEKRERSQIALRLGIIYFASCLGCVWLGHWLLLVLGITPAALMATGGLIFLLQAGVPMAFRGEAPRPMRNNGAVMNKDHQWRQHVVTPLFFPISFGGASISYIIAETSRFPDTLDKLAISTVCLVCTVVVFLTVKLSVVLNDRLSDAGRQIMTKVSGVVIIAISIQLLVRGLVELAISYGITK